MWYFLVLALIVVFVAFYFWPKADVTYHLIDTIVVRRKVMSYYGLCGWEWEEKTIRLKDFYLYEGCCGWEQVW